MMNSIFSSLKYFILHEIKLFTVVLFTTIYVYMDIPLLKTNIV
jgi:hypothetical protein